MGLFDGLKWLLSPGYFVTLCTFWGGGKDGGDAPDYGALAAASEKAAVLGKELGDAQLEENKRQYNMNMQVAQPVIEQQSQLMGQQQRQGDDYYNYMKQYSRPAEQSLFYEAMGFNPDEIAQIEALRGTETRAAQEAAAQKAATAGVPSFVELPTQTIKTVMPDGAIKGSDINGFIRMQQSPTDNRYVINSGMDRFTGFGGGNNPIKPDASSYYVKNADGTYKVVTPGYETVNGTQTVAVPGKKIDPSAGMIDTPKTNKLVSELAARAGLRQQEEGASTAIADSRKGFTDANNMAIRQGLRYGMSADKIAAAQGALAAQQAETQAGAANAGREKAKNLSYAKKLDVAGLYRGLPGASQAAYGLTLNAGNSAVNNQNSTSAQYVNGMNAGTNTIMNGQNMRINGLGQIASAQTSAYNAANSGDGGMGAMGSMVGMLGSAAITA